VARDLLQRLDEGEDPSDAEVQRAWTKRRDLHEREVAEIMILRQVVAGARDRLGALVRDLAEEIVVQHLRPALEDVLSAAENTAPALAGARTMEEVLRSDDRERAGAAWQRLGELGLRFAEIRATYEGLHRLCFAAVTKDVNNRFVAF